VVSETGLRIAVFEEKEDQDYFWLGASARELGSTVEAWKASPWCLRPVCEDRAQEGLIGCALLPLRV
jgi:hypothetical protein